MKRISVVSSLYYGIFGLSVFTKMQHFVLNIIFIQFVSCSRCRFSLELLWWCWFGLFRFMRKFFDERHRQYSYQVRKQIQNWIIPTKVIDNKYYETRILVWKVKKRKPLSRMNWQNDLFKFAEFYLLIIIQQNIVPNSRRVPWHITQPQT